MSLSARSMIGLHRDILRRPCVLHLVSAIHATPCRRRSVQTFSTNSTETVQPSPDVSVVPPPTSSSKPKVRASNPMSYQRAFFDPETYHQNKKRNDASAGAPKIARRLTPQKREKKKSKKEWMKHLPRVQTIAGQTLGQQLIAGGETIVPKSTWVLVESITPTSTLEAMLRGIRTALDTEQARGMVDLDALWSPGQKIPCLEKPVHNEEDHTNDRWVRKAKLVLSPFGRPTGWYLQFENRSIVYALLKYAEETSIRCAWREVRVRAYAGIGDGDPTKSPVSENPNFHFNEQISDNTVRVENCPPFVNETALMHFFSRYDLHPSSPMMKWEGRTSDGKIAPNMFIVHFADAAWARAAIREKQETFIQTNTKQAMYDLSNMNNKGPKPLRLVQYPKQIL